MSVVDIIRARLLGGGGGRAVAPKVVPGQIIVTVSIPANTPSGATLFANITTNPAQAPQPFFVLPPTEDWVIDDIFIKASGDIAIDGQLRIILNDREILIETPNVSTLLVSNPSRPRTPAAPVVIPRGSKLSIAFVTAAPAGTSAATNTIYIAIRKVVYG